MVAPLGLPVCHDRDIDFLVTLHGSTSGTPRQVISMLEFLIDNIFVSFGETLIQLSGATLSLSSFNGPQNICHV
jgi:hypothetical protein